MKFYINKLAKTAIALLFSFTIINQNLVAMWKKRLILTRSQPEMLNAYEYKPSVFITPKRRLHHACIPEAKMDENTFWEFLFVQDGLHKQELIMIKNISKYLQERKMLQVIPADQNTKPILSNQDIALEIYIDSVLELFDLSDSAIDHAIAEVRQYALPIEPEDLLDIIDILTLLKQIP
jgi:hypothetical protein